MRPIQISQQEAIYVSTLTEKMINAADKQKSLQENMIQRFQEHFAGKQEKETEDVVNKIIEGVTSFTKNYEKLTAGEEINLDEMTGNLPLKQQYECLLNVLIALKTFDSQSVAGYAGKNDIEINEIFKNIEEKEISVSGDEISEETLNELKLQVTEAIQNSTFCIAGNECISDLIKEMSKDENALKDFTQKNWTDFEFKTYSALAAYIAALEEKISSVDKEIDPQVLAAGVAAGIERDEIIRRATLGEITWEYAVKALKIIGAALIFCVLAFVAATIIALSVFGGVSLLSQLIGFSIITVIIGAILGGFVSYKLANWIMDKGLETMPSMGEMYDKATNYIRETLYPQIVAGIKTVGKFIDEKILKGFFHIKINKIKDVEVAYA